MSAFMSFRSLLPRGERLEANAALRTIVRRDSGEGYRAMLTRMARESGVETPTAEDLVRLDRNRKGKKLSNADGQSSTAPDGWIAKLKDGRTHLAYKPEHAMDLDTGAVVTAEVHAADQGDTATMPDTLANAIEHLTAVDAAPSIRVSLAGRRTACPFQWPPSDLRLCATGRQSRARRFKFF
jgi:transposase